MAEKKINGRTFKVDKMLATEALVLQARVVKIAGPALEKLGVIMQGQGSDKTPEQKAASDAAALTAIVQVFAQADPVQLVDLLRDIVAVAHIRRPSGNYDPCDIDGDFTENQGDIFPVVLFVLQEQFSSFFSGLLGSGNPGSKAKA